MAFQDIHAEKRTNKRYALTTNYQLDIMGETYLGVTANISLSGIYLKNTNKPFPENYCGEACQLILYTPHDNQQVNLLCHIVYAIKGGVGLKFAFSSKEKKDTINKIIEYVDNNSRKSTNQHE